MWDEMKSSSPQRQFHLDEIHRLSLNNCCAISPYMLMCHPMHETSLYKTYTQLALGEMITVLRDDQHRIN